MPNANTSYVLEYSLLDNDQGVSLKIWEPTDEPSGETDRTKPYLFSANYQLSSKEAALQVLNRHLLAAGAQAITSDCLTAKGKLDVVPHPTDEIYSK